MNWRDNPNLVECFENCVAMFHAMPEAPPPKQVIPCPISGKSLVGGMSELRSRRLALGLRSYELCDLAGVPNGSVSETERGIRNRHAPKIIAALDRLEAERAKS